MKYLYSRYFIRLVVFCLLISVLPVISIGLFSYSFSSRMIQNKVNEGNSQILLQTQLSVEKMLKITESTTLQLLMYANGYSLNYNGFSFNNLNLSKDYDVVNKMVDDLNGFIDQSIKLEDAMLVCTAQNYAISTKGYFNLGDLVEKKQLLKYDSMPDYAIWGSWTGPLISSASKTDNSQIPGVIFVRKMYPMNSQNPNSFMVVKISRNEINKLITGNSDFGDILILDKDFNLIAGNNPQVLNKGLATSIYGIKIKEINKSSGQFSSLVDNTKVQINFLKSDYNGWIYISTVPIKSVTRDSHYIGLASFITCFVIILILIIISVKFSKKVYSPINSFYELILKENKKARTKDNMDELKYLDENIKKLFIERKQLTNQLVSQNQQFKEYYAGRLLQGEISGPEVIKKLQDLGYCTTWKYMCVIVLEIDTLEGTAFNDSDRELVSFAINNIITDLIPEDKRMGPISLNKACVVIMGDFHDIERAYNSFISAQGAMIQNKIEECIGVNVSIGIGRTYNSLNYISSSYREAVEALKDKIFFGDKSIIHNEEVNIKKSCESSFPLKIEEEVINAVQYSDINSACVLLEEFVKRVSEEKTSYLDYQVTMGKFIMDILQISRESQIPLKQVVGEEKDIHLIFQKLNNQKDILEWLKKSVIIPTMKRIEEKRTTNYKKISQEIVEMIHMQYDTDLTLEICAKRLNYNAKYVSRAFKDETGITFSDYLLNYRLEVSKKLLRDTDIKINDIAENLRYQNPQNFIRCFKKVEGITPGQYRENCRNAK